MSEIISKQDTPVAVIHDPLNPQTPYVILDVKGVMRAQFVSREEADAFAETVNAPEPEEPALKEEDEGGNEVARDQEDPEQQKEDDMPRGIPNKKKAVKKRAVTAVKKTAQKVKKAVKKKAAKRKSWREY